MSEPKWLNEKQIRLLHADLVRRYGGSSGLRDRDLLQAALARPRNVFNYEEGADLADLAAAYWHSLVRNHPFVDGNKRIGFTAMRLFLWLNSQRLTARPQEAYLATMAVAEGDRRRDESASWIRERLRARDK